MQNASLLPQIIILTVLFSVNHALHAQDTADSELEGSFAVSYTGVPDDEQTSLGLSLSLDLSGQTEISLSTSGIEALADSNNPNSQLSDINASLVKIGFEHWLANKKVGFGLAYSRWDDGDQLGNNDLIGSFLYQLDYWIFALEATLRQLENSSAIFSAQNSTSTDNDALGLGLSAIYVGIDNIYLSFAYDTFSYANDILSEAQIEENNQNIGGPGNAGFIPPGSGFRSNSDGLVPVDSLQYVDNFPLAKSSTNLGIGYFFTNDSILSVDIAFSRSLFGQNDSSSYGLNYSIPLSDDLDAGLGAAIYEQGTIKSEIYNFGLTWGF